MLRAMIVITFEVTPAEGCEDAYLALAARMRPLAEAMPGFVSVERFRSIADPRKLVSVSTFESEAAVGDWRRLPEHRAAQRAGRVGILADYRLRVSRVLRDYGPDRREEAPEDSNAVHCPWTADA